MSLFITVHEAAAILFHSVYYTFPYYWLNAFSMPYNTPLSCPPPPTFSFSVLLLCTVSNNTRFVMTCVFQINYAFAIVIDIPSDIHMAHLFIIFQDLLKCYLEQKDFSKKNDVFKLIFLEA